MKKHNNHREYDFALVMDGVTDLTDKVENALFEASCDDATFSIQYGHLYAEFSRLAPSLERAILSAIQDVQKANIGAVVLRVDECDLVTQSEIARRAGRSRQLISQYISGVIGAGNFPPPECYLKEGKPLWTWCAVSYWLAENSIIRSEEGRNASVVAAINSWLAVEDQRRHHPELVEEIRQALAL